MPFQVGVAFERKRKDIQVFLLSGDYRIVEGEIDLGVQSLDTGIVRAAGGNIWGTQTSFTWDKGVNALLPGGGLYYKAGTGLS
ncbi:hypothetical protein ACVFI8_15535 [Agarivorans sp. MS3-6]